MIYNLLSKVSGAPRLHVDSWTHFLFECTAAIGWIPRNSPLRHLIGIDGKPWDGTYEDEPAPTS